MPTLRVAHIRQQGQDMIIAPLDHSFEAKSQDNQDSVISEIEAVAHSAGLRGSAVVVWQSGGRMKFIAPTPWHPFFRSINWRWLMANLNQTLTW